MPLTPGSLRQSAQRGLTVAASAILLAAALAAPAQATSAAAPTPAAPLALPAAAMRHLCGVPAPGTARCHAILRTNVAPRATFSASLGSSYGYEPADLQAAYGLASAAASSGGGLTVAVVDAYDDPNAEADLGVYRSQFGLPACTTANGCFRKVDQNGGTAYPPANSGWAAEIALDLEMVSAICPNCRILLVEAATAGISDLGSAVNRAVALGAAVVSNSYGGPESPSEVNWDGWYNHPGVVITVSSGDNGYGTEYPASSPYVVAVGGTTLSPPSGGGWTETAWSGAGSGCSAYEPKPSWQHDAGCSGRTVADVSAVADPTTGVAIYCTYGAYCGGWEPVGGTSASAPIVAAAYAIAAAPAAGTYPASYPYLRGGLVDVTSGSNGTCSPAYLCTAGAGYDGPTGLGTPSGVTPFTAPTLPGKPTGATASAGNQSITASWSAPASNGGTSITGYTATTSPGGRSCTTGGALGCTITGLAAGTAYTVTVTAANAVGTGPASDASAAATPFGPPGKPTGVYADNPQSGSLDVHWTAAPANGAAITGYTAAASPGGQTCTAGGSGTSCTVAGLANGTPVTFSVTAANAAGPGAPSDPSAAATPYTVPGAPMSVTATAGNTTALVAWQAPASNGGAAITAYTVTATPGGETCAWASGPLECTVTGLANGTPYTFTVAAANAAGAGPASGPAAATPTALPDAPTGVSATVPVGATGPVAGALAVSWSAPSSDGGSPITAYTATVYDAATSSPTGAGCSVAGTPAATGCEVTGLTPGVPVFVRVSASTALGAGLPSAPSATATPPAPPSAAAVAALPMWSLGTFSVAWSGVQGTLPIASYDVRYRQAAWNGGFGGYVTWQSATAATSAPFAPSAGATYCISVRARDTLGFVSGWSAERCTALPLDDRSLYRSGYWGSGTGSAFYRGTWIRSSAYGSRAYRTSVVAKRLALVATTCPTCGSVRVYWGSTLVRTISLYSRTTRYRQVITITTFSSPHAGTVTVKLSSSGRRVYIDGLAISRV